MYAINARKLTKLAKLAAEIAREAEDATPLKLNPAQREALYSALRLLDIRNDYEVGDALRVAFKVELDGLRAR